MEAGAFSLPSSSPWIHLQTTLLDGGESFLATEATICILVKVRTALISAFAVQFRQKSEFCRSHHAFIQLHLD
jgi:hypothetical protein